MEVWDGNKTYMRLAIAWRRKTNENIKVVIVHGRKNLRSDTILA